MDFTQQNYEEQKSKIQNPNKRKTSIDRILT